MSRYQELQSSLSAHLADVDAYWADLRGAVNSIMDTFSNSLELSSTSFQNEEEKLEQYVKLGVVNGGKFSVKHVFQLPTNGNALEFAVSLVVISSSGARADIAVPLALKRQDGSYIFSISSTGQSSTVTDRDFTEFADLIYQSIRISFDRRP